MVEQGKRSSPEEQLSNASAATALINHDGGGGDQQKVTVKSSEDHPPPPPPKPLNGHREDAVVTSSDQQDQQESWPFETPQLYRIAFNFFKGVCVSVSVAFLIYFIISLNISPLILENESKAFHPSYDQRNAFVAYSLQEKHGKFNPEKARPLGALDFVGHDRRYHIL